MMRILLGGTLITLLLSASLLHADSVTVGNYDGASCYAFFCNDSGTSSGVSIDYQQVYNSAMFKKYTRINIHSLAWQYWTPNSNEHALGGRYSFYWGYSAVGLNLSSNLASNYKDGRTYMGSAVGFGTPISIGTPGMFYLPSLGDLILEIVVTNQANVPNTGANGYAWADYTGTDTLRAWCYGTGGCSSGTTGALVTTFDFGNAAPEPGTAVMFGSGIIGLAGVLRRKINL